ncbi:MAG: BMP family ABC transporter substrate-binding protein [Alicyclobacillus sp.]|nr:BMP family ABC transporter substrate-binding protein [Alicyclobacillus sp.]
MLALSTVLAGCGAANNAAGGKTATGGNTTGGKGGTFKVGLVTDTGGLNDHSFNHLADVGLTNAEKQLGVQGEVVQSQSANDYVPNLTRFARNGDNLVIAVGYLMEQAVEQVAKEYPNTKFLIIDDAITDRPNVASAIFKTEQCGYLVGAMAGLMEKDKSIKGINSQNVLGVVGGQQIPPVTSYIAGFIEGAKKVDPGVNVIVKYANSFTDQAAGQQLAQSEISQGADIIFPVAGGTGNGAIDAAKAAGVYAIGVDANQNYLAPNTVVTSALKAVDTATFDVIKQAQAGDFKSGVQYFDLANNGVGIAPPISAVPQSIVDQVNQLKQQIQSGQITVSANMPQ